MAGIAKLLRYAAAAPAAVPGVLGAAVALAVVPATAMFPRGTRYPWLLICRDRDHLTAAVIR